MSFPEFENVEDFKIQLRRKIVTGSSVYSDDDTKDKRRWKEEIFHNSCIETLFNLYQQSLKSRENLKTGYMRNLEIENKVLNRLMATILPGLASGEHKPPEEVLTYIEDMINHNWHIKGDSE